MRHDAKLLGAVLAASLMLVAIATLVGILATAPVFAFEVTKQEFDRFAMVLRTIGGVAEHPGFSRGYHTGQAISHGWALRASTRF